MDTLRLNGFTEDAELLAEAVVDTVHESLLILDGELRVQLANRSFYKTFHVSPDATKGCLIYELGSGQWDVPRLRHLLEGILPTNSNFSEFEVSYDFPEIGRKVMVLNACKLLRRDQQKELILLAIEDMTERRTSEGLRRSNGELSAFAHSVSHDLQAPLRTLTYCTELIARKYKGKLDGEIEKLIHFILSATVNMQSLIQSLLGYAIATESEAGREPIQLQSVLDRAIENLGSGQIEDLEITSEPLPVVNGSTAQLLQLIQNLLSNAIKYGKPGLPVCVHVSVAETVEKWIFSFRDNGIGIAPGDHSQIFLPLKRLHGSEIPGTGIGLATCRKVIEHHGGTIWVESVLGSGATFYFTLPK